MHMIANAYVELGHNVTVVSPVVDKDPLSKYELHSLPVGGAFKIIKWAIALRYHDFPADIVHFSGEDYLCTKKQDCVHIRTFLGSCLAEAIVAKRLFDNLRMLFIGLTEFYSALRSQVTTVISNDTNKYIGNRGISVPCGVDLQNFRPASKKHPTPAILFVGILDSRKRGRALLTEFVNIIQPRFPDAELWLVRESGNIDIPGVRVFGSVTQEKLVELYQTAWVFCLPSSYEGFGVPYIEAMACGTPVVATPNPGALEVLDNGTYGVITELDNLGASINSLLSNEDDRCRYIDLGLRRSKEYGILKVAQKYIDLAIEYRDRKLSK
jgi:glycosyltransferase involved in cell wall biosynthesis